MRVSPMRMCQALRKMRPHEAAFRVPDFTPGQPHLFLLHTLGTQRSRLLRDMSDKSTRAKEGRCSMSTHTPGPWTHVNGDVVDATNTKIQICGISMPSGYVPADHVGFANARLIAAAPELYEACQAVLGHFAGTVDDNVPLPLGYALQQKLRRAIAKATGESQ